jgi:hypothetical protein
MVFKFMWTATLAAQAAPGHSEAACRELLNPVAATQRAARAQGRQHLGVSAILYLGVRTLIPEAIAPRQAGGFVRCV